MNIEKRGDKYRIREMYNGKVYRKTLTYKPTKKEASNIIYKLINEDEDNEKLGYKTLKEACVDYINLKGKALSPTTIRGYNSTLRCLDEQILKRDIELINSTILQSYANELLSKLSVKTVKNRISFIESAIKYAIPDKAFTVIYPKVNKEEPYIPSDDDIKALAKHFEGSEYEIIFKLSIYGLRLSETTALTVDDFNNEGVYINKSKLVSDNGYLIAKRNKTAKSCRFVPLPSDIIELVKCKGYIYNCSPNSFNKVLTRAQEKLNIPHFSAHKLRHYFASKAHALGISEASILAIGGWATSDIMKSVYRHAEEMQIKKDIQSFNNHLKEI